MKEKVSVRAVKQHRKFTKDGEVLELSLEGEWVFVRRMRWKVSPEQSSRKKAQRCETAQVTASCSEQLEQYGVRWSRGEG